MRSPIEHIRERIKNSSKGTIFVPSDFIDLADYGAVKMGLSRLVKSGLVRRIIRGVYEYPEYNDFIKEFIVPSPHKIAQALARNNSWTIVPVGDTALNQLGLSTQVPAVWTYVSNGPYREYSVDKIVIRFKRTASKDISKLSYKSALLVQAIKAIGKDRLDSLQMGKIARLLSADERSALLTEGQYMTAWIYESIKKICSEVA